jgi:hypothetical protein
LDSYVIAMCRCNFALPVVGGGGGVDGGVAGGVAAGAGLYVSSPMGRR